MPTSIELRQQRASVVEQMRQLVDHAETEGRDLDATERESYERGETDYTSLTGRIARQETLERAERDQAEPIPHPDDPGGRGGLPGGRGRQGEAHRASDIPDDAPNRAQRVAFLDLVRGGYSGLDPAARALVEDTSGQILVPEELEAELIRSIPALTVMRNIVSVRPTQRNRIRRRSLDEVTVGWGKLETGTALTDSMPTTPAEEFTFIEDLYGLAKIGEDELDDSDVNLEAFVVDSFARALAEAEDTGATIGTGHANQQPIGWTTAGGGVTAVNAAQPAAVTIDDFKKLIYAVPAQARRNGRFVTASTTELAISVLKDANDQYLWQASNQAGRPNTFLGYPIDNQEDVAAIPLAGTAAKIAGFGDWQQGYRFYDRLGMTLKRLEELYSEDGMIGFKVRRRLGGDVRVADYLRLLNIPAA